jgi:glycosyltransferase involved in cell wall biosynthesis
MIVKNESRVIERLLQSVAPIINSYVIYDTGSDDKTPDIIEKFMNDRDIRGEIFYAPFVNFEYNRNLALMKAFELRGRYLADFVLLLDADMVLKIGPNFSRDELDNLDHIQILQGMGSLVYRNTRIVRNTGRFKYLGATHEYVDCPDDSRNAFWGEDKLSIEDIGDGGSKGDKVERDIRLLLQSLETDPDNVRTHFYLANSYKNIKNYREAIYWYERRTRGGGWPEEVFYSFLEMGCCYKELGDMARCIESWLLAHQAHPYRVETLFLLVQYYRLRGLNMIADLFYKAAAEIVEDVRKGVINRDEFLFVNKDVYDYLLDVENIIISYYAGRRNVDKSLMNVLERGSDANVNNVLNNLKYYKYIPDATQHIILDALLQYGDDEFVSSSSSIIPYIGDNSAAAFVMNRRFVNYFIKEDGSYVSLKDTSSGCKNVATINEYVLLNAQFVPLERKCLDIGDVSRYYVGIEDVKLFRHGGKIHFMGTALRADGRLGISYGEYNSESLSSAVELTPAWNPQFVCEKNWVFAETAGELAVIYSWHPLVIGKIEGTSLVKMYEKETPAHLRRARGSTCGFRRGQEWFFVVHFVSYEQPRHYYHAVVVLNEDLSFKRMGRIFTFEGQPIEYCLGICADDDSLIVSYSMMDRTSRIKRFPISLSVDWNESVQSK